MRLIDADAYLQKLRADPLYYFVERYGVEGTIEAMPTIDAEPRRHGKWIYVPACEGADFGFYKCSLCGEPSWFKENYCANCGAKMEGAEG